MVLQKELPAEAQELAKRRFQIINVNTAFSPVSHQIFH